MGIIGKLLRRLGSTVRSVARPIRRRPRAALAVLVACAAGVLVATANLASTPISGEPAAGTGSASAESGPAFTYAGSWSLLDLQRHVQAGDVVAITAATQTTPATSETRTGSAAPTKGVLAARTIDGQVIRIELTVSPGDAAVALASMGHGSLLTEEAWKAARTAEQAGAGAASGAVDGSSSPLQSVLAIVIPLLAVILLLLFMARFARRASGMSREGERRFTTIMPPTSPPQSTESTAATGEADAAGRPVPGVRLDDVAGCDEAKLELTEAIEFLRLPEKFHKLGARVPRGILLYGPPGTGKTMLARAVAAEAGVAFHYASGSEFVEKYVGVGAKRIRELFATARKMGRGVIFFDEFDALGKARGGPNSHEEREQTLNQLLVELDGFDTTEDVIVIAATNRLDVLDPAVLRPGRFTRKIHVGLPDVAGRRDILTVHARNKPLTVTTDLESIARKTYGFSGAQLADLLNEAAILAARRGGEAITPDDLHSGWLKVAVGTSRRRSMDERERSIIAAHEVGHAICGKVHGDKRKVEEISLFAHGEALGVTVSSQEDNDLPAESDLRARLVALMGGRAAEELLFQEVTGGASNDFEKANQIATAMVTRWGMGRDPEAEQAGLGSTGRGALGFLVAHGNERLPGEVQAAATRAVRQILDEAYATACRTLVENIETLRRLAAYLVEHERVDGDTFQELFAGTIDVPAAAGEWRPETARPRAWTEIAEYLQVREAASSPRASASLQSVPKVALPLRTTGEPVGPGRNRVDDHPRNRADEAPVDPSTKRRPTERAPWDRPSGGRPRLVRRPSAAGAGAVARRSINRRLRGIAMGYVQRAETWLESTPPS